MVPTVNVTKLRIMCLSNMYPGPENPDYGAFVEAMCAALERAGHDVERVAISSRSHGPLHTPAKYAGLARRALMRTREVDVIYAHYLFPTGAVAAACGRLLGRPWVVTAHGRDVRNLRSPRIRGATGAVLAGASSVICVSRYLAAELRASGIALPPVRIASMGVDLQRFHPMDRTQARARLGLSNEPTVLAVGGLTERKNPLRLLQAFTRIRDHHRGARLAFVGDGPLAGALRSGAGRLGLAGSVVMPGALQNTDVADWMAAADVLAIPSLVEPLGVVALEALASGRPVAATRIGGAAEVVGRAGALVDPLDPGSIARGVLALLADPPSVETCRTAAAAHSVDRQALRVAEVLAAATHHRPRHH